MRLFSRLRKATIEPVRRGGRRALLKSGSLIPFQLLFILDFLNNSQYFPKILAFAEKSPAFPVMSLPAAPSRRHFLRTSLAALVPVALTEMPVPTQAATKFDRVVIDPGHGGKDPGSIWYGVKEKTLTLDLARRLETILKAKGIPTRLTRESDVFVELVDRAEVANASARTIFVSLHFNGHQDRSIRGIESFYYPGSTASRDLASAIQTELGSRILTRNRGIKPKRLKVLESTKGTAALVECGFLSNRWECQRCASPWLRQVLAEEIAQGIVKYR